jgi:hypothetical protein
MAYVWVDAYDNNGNLVRVKITDSDPVPPQVDKICNPEKALRDLYSRHDYKNRAGNRLVGSVLLK